MNEKQLSTLAARAGSRLTVTSGKGATISYLILPGERLLRMSGSATPTGAALAAMNWGAACEALAERLESIVEAVIEPAD